MTEADAEVRLADLWHFLTCLDDNHCTQSEALRTGWLAEYKTLVQRAAIEEATQGEPADWRAIADEARMTIAFLRSVVDSGERLNLEDRGNLIRITDKLWDVTANKRAPVEPVEEARRDGDRKSDAELWRESQLVGAAVNEMADQIVSEGFSAERRRDLVRWLTWVAFMGAHPDAYEHHTLAAVRAEVGEGES